MAFMKVDLFLTYLSTHAMLLMVLMTLTLTQGHSGSAEETVELGTISTSKQAMRIQLAATVGHDKFYFNRAEIFSSLNLEL